MSATADILQRIIAHKHEQVRQAQQQHSITELIQRRELYPPHQQALASTRNFIQAIEATLAQHRCAVIAEIKKASPSKGVLREQFDPATIAQHYQQAGASCLSVLTDEPFFQGHADYLQQAKLACTLPVLRKDFIVDAYQVYQSYAMGADCILLIAAALTTDALQQYTALAHSLGMAVLIEVHNQAQLQQALAVDTKLIGINNRNLHDFSVNLNTTLNLLPQIPQGRIVVTESGIATPEDVALMRSHQVGTFLVGEAFMRHTDPGAALQHLFFQQ